MAVRWRGLWDDSGATVGLLCGLCRRRQPETPEQQLLRQAARRVREGQPNSFVTIAQTQLHELAGLPDTTVCFHTVIGGNSEFLQTIKRKEDRGLTEMGIAGTTLRIPDEWRQDYAGDFSTIRCSARFKINVYVNVARCKTFGSITQVLFHEVAIHAMGFHRIVKELRNLPAKRTLDQALPLVIVRPGAQHEEWCQNNNQVYVDFRDAFRAAIVQHDRDEFLSAERNDFLNCCGGAPLPWPP